MYKRAFLFFLIFLPLHQILPCLSAETPEKMRMAIMDLRADGVDKNTAVFISNIIRAEMINTGKFLVVERNQMDEILKEQGLQQTGCTDQECAVEVGKLISARKILIGEISRVGGKITVNVRVVDVEQGISEFAEYERGNTLDAIDSSIKKLTDRLTDRIIRDTPAASAKRDNAGVAGKSMTINHATGFVPGLGQINSGNTAKGTAIGITFLGTGVFTLINYINFKTRYNEYRDLQPGTSQEEYDSKYESAQKSADYANIGLGLCAAVYLYNWIDFIFFNKPAQAGNISASSLEGFYYTGFMGPSVNRAEKRVDFGYRFYF